MLCASFSLLFYADGLKDQKSNKQIQKQTKGTPNCPYKRAPWPKGKDRREGKRQAKNTFTMCSCSCNFNRLLCLETHKGVLVGSEGVGHFLIFSSASAKKQIKERERERNRQSKIRVAGIAIEIQLCIFRLVS
jgi:hypothetical protein